MLLSLVPLPYRILAIALLAVALFGFGWIKGAQHGERKLDGYKLAQAGQSLRIQTETIAKTKALQAQKDEALNAAAKKTQAAQAAAAGARRTADSLRDELAASRVELPSASIASVRRRADTLSELFGQCAAEVTELAGHADRLAIERDALIQAWPK